MSTNKSGTDCELVWPRRISVAWIASLISLGVEAEVIFPDRIAVRVGWALEKLTPVRLRLRMSDHSSRRSECCWVDLWIEGSMFFGWTYLIINGLLAGTIF